MTYTKKVTSPGLKALRTVVREKYAWPGGYALALVMNDGALLCPTCAKENYRLVFQSTKNKERDGWCVEGLTLLEDLEEVEDCAHCGKEIQ